jgi:hypothetical protein
MFLVAGPPKRISTISNGLMAHCPVAEKCATNTGIGVRKVERLVANTPYWTSVKGVEK